jgi:hypothetical protein
VRLLDAKETDGGRPAVERFVVEEYILDTITKFEVDRYAYVEYKLLSSTSCPSRRFNETTSEDFWYFISS